MDSWRRVVVRGLLELKEMREKKITLDGTEGRNGPPPLWQLTSDGRTNTYRLPPFQHIVIVVEQLFCPSRFDQTDLGFIIIAGIRALFQISSSFYSLSFLRSSSSWLVWSLKPASFNLLSTYSNQIIYSIHLIYSRKHSSKDIRVKGVTYLSSIHCEGQT